MSGQHTPGPWRLAVNPFAVAPEVINEERRIARVLFEDGSEDPEVHANAHLIAAAPKLKDALIDLMAAVDDLCRKLPRDADFCADYIPQWDALERAGLAAEAAIARARGCPYGNAHCSPGCGAYDEGECGAKGVPR